MRNRLQVGIVAHDVARKLAVLIFMFAAAAMADAVRFVSPQPGGQAIGVQAIEVTTTVPNVDRVDFYVDGQLVGAARKPPFRIAHDFGTALDAHRIAASVYSDSYRHVATSEIITAALTAGEVMNVDFVEVPLRVRSSRAVRPQDLRVRENGVEQTIREIRSDRGAARFVFVVDHSLSMSGGKLAAALRAIDRESNQLHEGDRAEVVLFNHIVSRPVALPRGARATGLVGDVGTSGGTSLRDAVSSIATADRTYVIVITDGGDRNSETSEEKALQKISRTKTVVDAVILGDRSSFLERAAKNTGGTVARANASTIQRELHKIFLDINSRYLLAYQSTVHTPGWRAIDVQPRRRDLQIMNARKGYFAQ